MALPSHLHDITHHRSIVGNGHESLVCRGIKKPEDVAALVGDDVIDLLIIALAIKKLMGRLIFCGDFNFCRHGQIAFFNGGDRFTRSFFHPFKKGLNGAD